MKMRSNPFRAGQAKVWGGSVVLCEGCDGLE